MFDNELYIVSGKLNQCIPIKKFNGGEVNISFHSDSLTVGKDTVIEILAYVTNSDGILAILMLNDALRRRYPNNRIDLTIPYLPYARQDRVCNEGESLSIKVMTDLINMCDFNKVTVWDCHSEVGPALLNRCENIPQYNLIKKSPASKKIEERLRDSNTFLISPDSGALKKIYSLAKHFQISHERVILASKYRDTKTGHIINSEVHADDLKGRPCIICDDICENGRTFIELAKKLKEKNAGDLILFTTHGIYPNGKDELLKYFTKVECANPFKPRSI